MWIFDRQLSPFAIVCSAPGIARARCSKRVKVREGEAAEHFFVLAYINRLRLYIRQPTLSPRPHRASPLVSRRGSLSSIPVAIPALTRRWFDAMTQIEQRLICKIDGGGQQWTQMYVGGQSREKTCVRPPKDFGYSQRRANRLQIPNAPHYRRLSG